MRRLFWWPVKAFVFSLLRPFFVPDADPNEDYECVVCGNPVLRRRWACSRRCEDDAEFMT